MQGFLGSFLQSHDKRAELTGEASSFPLTESDASGYVSIQPDSSAPETGLPAPGNERKVIADPLASAACDKACAEGAAVQATWDADRAAAVVTEVDRIIKKEVAPGGAANTEARRRVLKNDGSIVRRLQQARDSSLWEWPAATFRLLSRWAAWDARSHRLIGRTNSLHDREETIDRPRRGRRARFRRAGQRRGDLGGADVEKGREEGDAGTGECRAQSSGKCRSPWEDEGAIED